MKCESCNRDFPSVYYFSARGICTECYEKLSEREKDETEPLYRPLEAVRKPRPKLIAVMKGITTFLVGFMILGLAVLTLALIAGMIDPQLYRFESFKDFGIMYTVGENPWRFETQSELISEVSVTPVAAIEFALNDRKAILLYFLSKYLFISFTLIIFYKLRQILISLEEGNPFIAENARRVRWIGYAVLGMGLAGIIVGGAVLMVLSDPIRINNTAVDIFWMSVLVFAADNLNSLFWGGLVLLAAEILRQAILIKQEQDLTV